MSRRPSNKDQLQAELTFWKSEVQNVKKDLRRFEKMNADMQARTAKNQLQAIRRLLGQLEKMLGLFGR